MQFSTFMIILDLWSTNDRVQLHINSLLSKCTRYATDRYFKVGSLQNIILSLTCKDSRTSIRAQTASCLLCIPPVCTYTTGTNVHISLLFSQEFISGPDCYFGLYRITRMGMSMGMWVWAGLSCVEAIVPSIIVLFMGRNIITTLAFLILCFWFLLECKEFSPCCTIIYYDAKIMWMERCNCEKLP